MADEELGLLTFLKTHEEEILANWLEKACQLSPPFKGTAKSKIEKPSSIPDITNDCCLESTSSAEETDILDWIKNINQKGHPAGFSLKQVVQGQALLREVITEKLWAEQENHGWDLEQVARFSHFIHQLIGQQVQKVSELHLETYPDDLLISADKHQQLMGRLPEVIYSYSPQKSLTFINQASQRLLGISPQEFYQQGFQLWIDHVHPVDREKFLTCFNQQLRTKEEMEYEYRMLHKNGCEILHVVNRSIPIVDMTGELLSIDGIVIDITERKKMEHEICSRNRQLEKLTVDLQKSNQELLKLGQRKSELVHIVAHDLRNPLNSISIFTELLLMYQNSPEEYVDFLHRIDEETIRLTNLIDNFLDIEKIEAGLLQYKEEEVNIVEIVEHFFSIFKWEIDKKRISFKLKNLDKLPPIRGDKTRLNQVFSNLLGNAIKYTPRGGKIRLSSTLVKGTRKADRSEQALSSLKEEGKCFTKISLWNSGHHIPKKYHKKIFAKFFQLDSAELKGKSATTCEQKGSGLGLAIAKEIIEHHGGRIWVESDSQQDGVTFFFTLPIGKNAES